MGVVGRPHGVRGLVRVHSYTATPSDLAAYRPLLDDQGRAWTLDWRSEGVAALSDAEGRPVADRSAAERLVNTRLYVERSQLPPPDPDEFYLADLVGMAVLDAAGRAVGRVAAVHDYGAGASLEIGRDGAASLLVPFTRASVPHIDTAGGTLVVTPPEEVAAPDAAVPDDAVPDDAVQAAG